MLKNCLSVSILAILSALALSGQVLAQGNASNLSGTYRCTPEPIQCQAPTFSVSQSGNTLELKAENGPVAEAKVTSNITLSAGPPFNSNGLVPLDPMVERYALAQIVTR